jgi:uncharacterized membrane protein YfhO
LIDKENEYTFFVTSDDGSRVLIDGKQVAIADGVHGPETGIGKVKLTKGLHKIELEYFEGNLGEALELEFQEQGDVRRKIPISKLFFK